MYTDIINELDICIISLHQQQQRRELLLNALKEQGLTARVSLAIDGKKLWAEEYFRQCRIRSSRCFRRKILTPSELACWLSHKKSLEEFISTDKSWLMILEDDVTINRELSPLLNALPCLDTNGIFILGGQNGLKSFNRVVLFRGKNGITRPVLGTHRWLYRTCCYLTGRKAARQVIKLMEASSYIVDDWAYVLKHTTISRLYYQDYFSHPENLSDSTIEWERIFINKK